jgi:hypothetical protein
MDEKREILRRWKRGWDFCSWIEFICGTKNRKPFFII